MVISELDPQAVWEHFQALCEIPRPSKHEQAIRDYLKAWAEQRDLETQVDGVGNLLIRKPATPGREDCPGVVLQGHLDMVCQANSGVEHDFFRDPIRPVLKDGWLTAENTTLGADNGIGVAMGLAVLASQNLVHGPIEVLLTLDEEQDMGGAQGLEPGFLHGDYLLNLDTEEWGEFYSGSAGGVDVNVERSYVEEVPEPSMVARKLSLTGLCGGHSGSDIHLGRGSANKILVRLLVELARETDLRLGRFSGGTADNALAREAFATVTFPEIELARVQAWLAAFEQTLRQELAGVDGGVSLAMTPCSCGAVMDRRDQQQILSALHAAPHGVKRMSQHLDNVVETSNNLGIVQIAEGGFSANLMVRSLLDSATLSLAREIQSLFSLIGAQVEFEGGYPGWAPNPDSRLLALCCEVFEREYGKGTSHVKVIHAGLECGILVAKYPGMDIVSFGPDIRGAHAPGERVDVASVGKAWRLLQAILAAIPANWGASAA